MKGLQQQLGGKEFSCNAGDSGLIPGSRRYSGGSYCNPLQYSYLENPMDRGTWRATVHGVTKSRIQLSNQCRGTREKRKL